MSKQVWLTGITTTGTPHIGNYVGAIRPGVASSQDAGRDNFYFLADLHALVKNEDPDNINRSTLEIAAAWLALGLDTDNTVFYRQSDIPEIPALTWVLSSQTAKGLMNRAHAYKAAVAANEEAGNSDPDKGISMALFSYPVLMAADILMFNASHVPVGRDQKQHVEMARDIAQRFNHHYGNTIPLFEPPKRLRKLIMKIKTNSLEPGEPKETADSTLFEIYRAFATEAETEAVAQRYAEGIAWGEMKQLLFEYLDDHLSAARQEYERLIADPGHIESVLLQGADRAREVSVPLFDAVQQAIGIRRLKL